MVRKRTGLKFDTKGFERAARNIPNSLRTVMTRQLQAHAATFQDDITTKAIGAKLSGDWKRNRTRNRLASRSGDLRGSFRSKVFGGGSGDAREVGVRCVIGGSEAPYARIHEFGGTVRSTRPGGYLTIPMPDNLTGRGLTRFPSARLTPNSFLLKKNGRMFIVRPAGEEGLEFLWMLQKEVRIPKRLNFRRRWNSRAMQRDRISKLNRGIRLLLKKAGLA
jgi:hypothetical protein